MRYSEQNKNLKARLNKQHTELIKPHKMTPFLQICVILLKFIHVLANFVIFAEAYPITNV